MLEIDPEDTEEDKKLLFLISMASDWIENDILDRPLFYKTTTEWYNGSGTQKLLLKRRPVYYPDQIVVYVNQTGYFGAPSGAFSSENTLVYGGDFCLYIDWPDSPNGVASKNGILVRMGDFWQKPSIRAYGLLTPYLSQGFGNIQVTYTAGYTIDGLPNAIRMAMAYLIGRLRFLLPIGFELSGDAYEEKTVQINPQQKNYLLGELRTMLFPYRNWNFGGQGM